MDTVIQMASMVTVTLATGTATYGHIVDEQTEKNISSHQNQSKSTKGWSAFKTNRDINPSSKCADHMILC